MSERQRANHGRSSPAHGEAVSLAILVVSYRRADLLRRCLDSVRTQLPACPVLVWDNHSAASDEIRAMAAEYPEADWTFSPRNLGYAAAVNALAARVPEDDLLLLNPDAELDGPLARSRAALGRPGVAAVSPTVRDQEIAHRETTVLRELVSYAGYAERLRGTAFSTWYARQPSEVDGYLTGCCLLVSRRAWRALGPFDADRFYLYGEEAAWQEEARRRGWRLVLVDEPEVRHVPAGTVADDPVAVRRSADLLHAAVVQRLGLHGNRGAGAWFAAGARVLDTVQRSKRSMRAAAHSAPRSGKPAVMLTTNQLCHGGAERQRVLLANELTARGYPVTLVCLQSFGPLTAELDTAVRLVLAPWWQPVVDAPTEDRVLITGITNTEAGFATGWRAAHALRPGRHRWLAATHEPPEPDRPVYGRALTAVIGSSDGVIALSPRHWEAITRPRPLHERHFIAPNGTPLAESTGYRPGSPVRLGMLCRMVDFKNPHLLVAALATMPDLDWTLDLFGDGPERERFAARTPAAVADRVRWHGSSPGPDHAFAEIDVVCVPSRTEGFPLVVVEAMARGRPVIASAVGSLPDMLDDGKAGVLVEPVTVEAWADALRPVLRDPAVLTDIAEAGRTRVAELYTVAAMTDAYEDAIAEVW